MCVRGSHDFSPAPTQDQRLNTLHKPQISHCPTFRPARFTFYILSADRSLGDRQPLKQSRRRPTRTRKAPKARLSCGASIRVVSQAPM